MAAVPGCGCAACEGLRKIARIASEAAPLTDETVVVFPPAKLIAALERLYQVNVEQRETDNVAMLDAGVRHALAEKLAVALGELLALWEEMR